MRGGPPNGPQQRRRGSRSSRVACSNTHCIMTFMPGDVTRSGHRRAALASLGNGSGGPGVGNRRSVVGDRRCEPPSDPLEVSRTSSGAPSSAAARTASDAARRGQAHRARAHRAAARPGLLRGNRQARHASLHRLRHGRAGHPRRRRRHRLGPHRRPRRSSSSRRTSPCSAARSRRPTPQKICKVMDLAMKTGRARSSASTTRAARASRKACCRSAATPTSSCATRSPPASCRRSPRSWDRAPAARSTRRPSPTSPSWSKDTSYMFVTGPDVIKTVTHEEVTKEELGGAMTHNTKSGVAHFAAHDDAECLAHDPRAAVVHAVEQPRGPAASRRSSDPSDRADAALDTIVPGSTPNQPYDMKDVIRTRRRRRRLLRGARALRAEHRRRLRAPRRPAGRRRRQPAGGPRRRARHRRVGQGRALRALLRRLQHPARHVRGRARLPARHATRSTAASSATARSCSTRSPRRRCRRSP